MQVCQHMLVHQAQRTLANGKKPTMKQTIGAGLLSCADKIWDTADTLRGAGIKASEWPA